MRTTSHRPTPLRHLGAAVLAAAAVAGSFLALDAAPAGAAKAPAKPAPTTTTTAPPAAFHRLAVNAGAAAQPTADGRTITDLQFFAGGIYAGYGDYGTNTGPVAVTSTNPTSGVSTEKFVQDTEAIYNHRVLGGKLYTPSIDPRVGDDYGVSGTWQGVDRVDAVHVFDMNTLTGTDLWMVGAKGDQAAAWRSTDGGATWQESLVVDAVTPGDFARFYFAGVLNGKLYVQAFDNATGAQAASRVFNGSTWSAGPAIVTGWDFGWRPVAFAGKLVFHGTGHARTGAISTFDGTTVAQIATGYDVDVAGTALYLLDAGGVVKKTTNLTAWSTVATAPAGARSVASDGVKVVVGTTASELWTI